MNRIKSLEEQVTDLVERNPQADAVNALIKVDKRERGTQDTDIELKTDLTEDEVKIHTVVDLMSTFLEMDTRTFCNKSVISNLVNKKERKALSKERKSREEIVTIARHPDIIQEGQPKNEGVLKRFFTSRRQVQ